ncbi:MAG: Crp/Fnr family transcriptional regulator [Ruminiclostridium sp.]|nr:Crp/Fnr family transcriptional regulator [Ruminiclostridium sp.]
MEFSDLFPVFSKLTKAQQDLLLSGVSKRTAPKGTVLHRGEGDCLGLVLVAEGQLRAFLTSEEGRQITLYRLFPWDLCLFSASCSMRSIQFDIQLEAERDTVFWLIPADLYQALSQDSLAVANHTNEILSARFTEVMWLMEQILWRRMDKRLAAFLLEESELEGSSTLKTTHDRIADHLGTAREVVTRMLRYLQSEGMVQLSRGSIAITDEEKLRELAL